MVKLDSVILAEIEGKQGGEHYRHDQCGFHLQQNPTKKRTPSSHETEQRRFFQQVTHAWSREGFGGDKADRESWKVYGQQHPKKNKKGEAKTLSGQTAFHHINLQRLIEGKPIIWNPDTMSSSPPLPRLAHPSTFFKQVPHGDLIIYIKFPQAMDTSDETTPPAEDFLLIYSLYTGNRCPHFKFVPTDVAWVNNTTLIVVFPIQDSPLYQKTINYIRGHESFFIVEQQRAYGSFTEQLFNPWP